MRGCFADLLAENGRLRYTPGIVSAFGKIMSAFRGEVVCTVTTAQVGWEALGQGSKDKPVPVNVLCDWGAGCESGEDTSHLCQAEIAAQRE